jgi:hypothetical protein
MIAGLDVLQAVVDLLVVVAEAVGGAPDDGHKSARNVLSGVYATKQ